MFKRFHGSHVMEALQRKKMRNLLSKEFLASRLLKIAIASLAMIILWALPVTVFGIDGLTIVQQRVIAIFAFAVLMWIFNAIPAWTTSTFVVVLLLFCTSDSSLWFFREGFAAEELGKLTSYKSLMACFADPIIMLFIGGFIIAIAATKTGLDVMLAKVMLKPFGTQSKYVLLGFITVTAVFSMFLSNTATAAMMLTFLAPVLKVLPADGKGKIGLALAIPVAANVGGMGTPIGTPPNAIALKYLNGAIEDGGMGLNIGFGEWMAFMIPFTLVLVFISWVLLLKLFPFKQKTITLEIKGEAKKDWRSIVVYITFAVTVLLWVLDKYTGVNSNVVAMLPVGVFCVIGVITRRDLEEISWGVLWMVAGGFALGVALNQTGLATTLINAIPFGQWSPLLVIIGSGLICYAMANFISHTATANLLVPILAVAGGSMATALAPLGGVTALLIGVAIASSLGMILPISTPPNAMAAATGLIEQKDMAKVGIIIGVVGLILGYVMLYFLGSNGLIGG
ncbi:MAG: SLC13/DASS family transporter [Muribaculaceae bacterium]|nr:SLC13/DASS family transporter [Muribaculaceae bacterium]